MRAVDRAIVVRRRLRETVRMTVEERVLARWIELAGEHSGAVGSDLVERYGEPHRRYHTVEHLAAVLAVVDDLADDADDIAAVRYAAFFHDAIYAVDRADNEERSAELAESTLPALGASPELTGEVGRLVRLTATHHTAADDRNGNVLCDADLAILAADASGYAAYTRAVRAEYRHVPDDLFRAGRAAVLRKLADQPYLFRTSAARRRYESAARANLAAELVALAMEQPDALR
ncbi:HD domain-containing protein [Nocardia gipuzkoensis]